MENQKDKSMENEMETGILEWLTALRVFLKRGATFLGVPTRS